MKRILIIAIILTIVACCVACGERESELVQENPTLVLIKECWTDTFRYQRVYYDADTRVMYVFIKSDNGGGLSPLYNADGTLRIYDEEGQDDE